MKKILLEKLLEKCREQTYQKQYEYIMNLLEEEKIKPVKASRLNGKSPALYREYWVLEEKKDYSTYIEELRYEIVPDISVDYYLRHLESYEADRTWVLELNQYLKNKKKTLQFKVSVNERSFEIWGQEKFLSRGQGKRILNRCGLELSFFNIYETTEPLAYYSRTRNIPQNLLILENKDTFFDIRQCMNKGSNRILGTEFGTVIYGAGKGIWKTFADYVNGAENYFLEDNTLFYFGDLDYEGILIYEHLIAQNWNPRTDRAGEKRSDMAWTVDIQLFMSAYEKMLDKALKIGFNNLPDMKEKQNANIGTAFLKTFNTVCRSQIEEILNSGKYIPQEILNEHDW